MRDAIKKAIKRTWLGLVCRSYSYRPLTYAITYALLNLDPVSVEDSFGDPVCGFGNTWLQ